MSKLQFNMNKTIKLQNVLVGKIDLENEDMDFDIIVEKMQSYIKVKGATQIGPLIQNTRTFVNDNEEMDMEINLMLQCNNYIHSVEKPYSIESIIRVPDCIDNRLRGVKKLQEGGHKKWICVMMGH